MKNLFVTHTKDKSGVTVIEYGLIVAGLSFAIIAIVQGITSNAVGLFTALKGPLALLQ
jgi:Flp pilus assembly pilin Flp